MRAIIGTRKGKLVGVANSRCLDFNQNLALFWTFEADLNDFEWLCLLERNCRTGFHKRHLAGSNMWIHINRTFGRSQGKSRRSLCQRWQAN